MQARDILDAIDSGQMDTHLKSLSEAIIERRGVLGRRKHREFNVGDVVRFVGLGAGAKYMNGLRARIVEINPKTVWVELLPEDRAAIRGTRFGRSSRIKVYPNSIELAFVNGHAQPAFAKIEDYRLDHIDTYINGVKQVKNVTPMDGEL